MQATWRIYLIAAAIACVVSAGTAFVTVRSLAPTSAPSGGTTPRGEPPGDPPAPDNKTVALEGVIELELGREAEVFYKIPFASPPYVTFPDGLVSSCKLTEQKAASFKLRRAGAISTGSEPDLAKVKWKAEGQPQK